MTKVLIISFDALEYTLVEQFNSKVLKQEEYGKIDLQPYFEGGGGYTFKEGVTEAQTDEVYATLLTGKTPNEHGVKIKRKEIYPLIQSDIPHLFRLPNTLPIEVPNINCSWVREMQRRVLQDYLRNKTSIEKLEYECYKYANFIRKMSSVFGYPDKDLAMAYFWFTDLLGHAYCDNSKFQKNLKTMYKYCEGIVKRITYYVPTEALLILIISDHGMLNGHHTDYGFWSSNKPLGLGKNIKVTDWYSIVLKWLKKEG